MSNCKKSYYERYLEEKQYGKLRDYFNECESVMNHLCYHQSGDEIKEKCAEATIETLGLIDLIQLFNLKEEFDIKAELKNSLNYKQGLKQLIEKIELELSHEEERCKMGMVDAKGNYFKLGYNAGNAGENLNFYAFRDASAFRFYDIILGALYAYNLPKLKEELQLLENGENMKSQHISTATSTDAEEKAADIEPMDRLQWKKKLPLLAFLFHQLEEKSIIQKSETGKFAATIAATFIGSDYNPIDHNKLNSYLSKFRTSTTKPNGSLQINEIIAIIQEIDKKL